MAIDLCNGVQRPTTAGNSFTRSTQGTVASYQVVSGLPLKTGQEHVADLFAHGGVVCPVHSLVVRSPKGLRILRVHQQHQPRLHALACSVPVQVILR